jgi:hypothetical protein
MPLCYRVLAANEIYWYRIVIIYAYYRCCGHQCDSAFGTLTITPFDPRVQPKSASINVNNGNDGGARYGGDVQNLFFGSAPDGEPYTKAQFSITCDDPSGSCHQDTLTAGIIVEREAVFTGKKKYARQVPFDTGSFSTASFGFPSSGEFEVKDLDYEFDEVPEVSW